MEPLCIAVARYLPKESNYFFRPSDKFYYELDLWETDFEDRFETYIKLSDLRYAIERGFDLKKHVMDYIAEKPKEPGYLEPIYAAFRRYIKFMRTGSGISDRSHNSSSPIMQLGLEELINVFCEEVRENNVLTDRMH